jgi:actin-like protein 6A
VRRERLAGAALTAALGAALEKAGAKVDPPYAIKKVEKRPGEWSAVRTPFPKTHPTYKAWAVASVLSDAKEVVCRLADAPFDPANGGTPGGAPVPATPYELPDGTEVGLGVERFAVPEALFRPSILADVFGLGPPYGRSASGDPPRSVPGLIRDAIAGADVDVRRDLFSAVVLTGGTSAMAGLRDRVERDLADGGVEGAEASCSAAGIKPKVAAPGNATERRFGVWIGGSILASLGSFQQMWMSKAEYDEHGKSLIHRRSP